MSIESFRGEFEKMGHTVYIFAPTFKGYEDKNPNVHRYPALDITFRGIRFPLAIPFSYRMDRILEKLEIDVIHAQHPNLLGWQAKRWAKKKNIPLIFTWHTLYDQYAHFAPFFVPKKIAQWWSISNAVRFANTADFVVAPTFSVIRIIKSWGMKNPALDEVLTGIDEKLFLEADGKSIRKKFAIADEEILLVLVTRFTAEKNVEFLLSAVIKALKENKMIKFLAAGNGNMLEPLQELAKKEGLTERIIFPGFVGSDIKKHYYAAGDIFVFASKSETQGMIISEALYMGLPVVAVSATGVKDMVMNQVNGLLIKEDMEEFSNAVLRLAADEKLRRKFSQNAREIARKNYTATVCAQKLLKIYEKAAEKKFL